MEISTNQLIAELEMAMARIAELEAQCERLVRYAQGQDESIAGRDARIAKLEAKNEELDTLYGQVTHTNQLMEAAFDARIAELEAENETLHGEMAGAYIHIKDIEAQLAAAQPSLSLAKWAIDGQVWLNESGDWPFCAVCMGSIFTHEDDCPIPALIAPPEADNA